jgi:hypothetical protein
MFIGSQAQEAGLHEQQPKDTQEKLKLKGDHQARVHSDQMFLMVVRQGGWTAVVANNFRQPRDLLNGQYGSPAKKELIYSLSRGC